jgi:uncharacterized repeat protein (TIGR01451 family)
VADSLPAGLTFKGASHGGALAADGTVRWPAFALAVGAHRDLTVTATADEDVRTTTEDDGDLDNTAAVLHPGDPNPGNDHDTVVVPIDHPDLIVEKDDGVAHIAPGAEVTYTIRVRNAGEGDAAAVVLTDDLPPALEFIRGSDAAVHLESDRVTWPAFDLDAGAERSTTVTVRVAEDVEAGTVVRNLASALHPDDLRPADNRDDDRDTVDGPDHHAAPPRVDDPDPGHDAPVPGLPRTGGAALAWAAIGAGLVALGLAARSFSSRA